MTFKFVSIYKPADRSRAADPFRIALQLPGGRRRYITGHTKRAESERLAERLSDVVQSIHAGDATEADLDAILVKFVPLATHVTDYHDHLYDVGRTKKHADQMWQYVDRLLASVRSVDALTPVKVEAALAKVKGSGATRKRHLDALKAFLAWGYRDRRWGRGPLDAIAGIRLRAQRERVRRILSLEELGTFITAVEDQPVREGLSAWQRSVLYRLTLAAGLRASEVPHIEISGERVNIAAKHTKARKRASIRIPSSLATQAAAFDWSAVKPANLARMLKSDLFAAGIDYEAPEGVFDFHALRHQCGALLASARVPVKAIQAHMRHASVRMTLDTYGHLLDVDRRAAAIAMDEVSVRLSGARERIAQRALPGAENVGQSEAVFMSQSHDHWSDGESNPDLLNAIQQRPFLNTFRQNGLLDARGRRVAPGAAQRLLRRLFVRAERRSRKGGAR